MIFVLTLLAALVGAVSSEHYHIVPTDSIALCQHYPNGTCFTLEQLSSQISDTGDITISFLPGEHLLTWNMTFINRTNIILNSEQLDNLSDSSAPRISFAISNINIEVKDTHIFILKRLVIHGYDTRDIIKLLRGGAIVILRTTAVIKDSVFKNNSASQCSGARSNSTEQKTCFYSAGVLYSSDSNITIDSCVFDSNTAYDSGAVFIHTGSVYINNCSFENNQGAYAGAFLIIESCGTITSTVFKYNRAIGYTINDIGQGVGGALGIYKSEIVKIRNSTFEHNTAFFGGALSILYCETVKIRNSTFEHNTAYFGGAVVIQGEKVALIYIINSTFSYNQANHSGGAIYSLESNELTFSESSCPTRIENNRAGYGGAIYLGMSTLNGHGNVLITNNTAKIGGGIHALYGIIKLYRNKTIQLVGNTALQDGGGFYLVASSMTILGHNPMIIDNNIAHNYGGGFYLRDQSQLIINTIDSSGHTPSIDAVHLGSNSAKRGGGIYVSDRDGQDKCSGHDIEAQNIKCFITFVYEYAPGGVSLYFANNSAVEAGSDIYGGLLDRCWFSYTNNNIASWVIGIEYLKGKAKFSWDYTKTNTSNQTLPGVITDSTQFFDHISSEPVKVCFCENNNIDCNYTHLNVFKKKGETFTLSVVAVDQVGKPVNATIISSLPKSKNGQLKAGQQYRQLRDQCTELEYNVYSNESNTMLQLYAQGPCTNLGISKQEVNIIFDRCTCPIGLQRIQDPIDCSCECTSQLTPYISNCSSKTGQIQINENIWIKYTNHTDLTTHFITYDCPFDYCVQKPVNISLANQTEADKQCAFHRTGKLCGQCKEGLSLVFASSTCQHCSNYYLFLLLPIALAGIALVAFILLLNITVATGTIHGLIFYANILAANRSIFLPFDPPNFLTVFISWLNLDLGIETCFYNGMDSYGKFLLQLVFPAYVFLLIAVIMVLCNRSHRIAHLFGKKNPEATLYTLILLSYSKLIRIIIAALQFARMSYPDGLKLFWLFDANVPYFTATHIPRFLAAFIITTLGVVYTTLLLFGQLFNRCSEYRLMKWTTHRYYIHFLKAHHAPLSDKHRYWVGLLLLARLVHYFISAFADDSVVILSVSAVSLLLLLQKLANKTTFSYWMVDWLETISIANLTILAVSTFYVKESKGSQQSLAIVSMSVSFIAFLGIVLYHILDTCGVRLGELPNKLLTKLREQQHYQPAAVIEEQLEDDDELLIQLDEVHNYANSDTDDDVNDCNNPARYITPPIIRSAVPADQLREPALDDLTPVRPEDYNIPPVPRPQHRQPTFSVIDIRARETD